jgi:N-methylhydantoinase B
MNAIELNVFNSRIEAVCDEMGGVLKRTAFSPNIKDRLDFSCAIFDAEGLLCAQAAHIPVHLGSMAYAMKSIVEVVAWVEGDMLVLNDPFLGGTHLPDVTLVAPVFVTGVLVAFVVNRAHHANIGASTPGSMPVSCTLEEEGVLIKPQLLISAGTLNSDTWSMLEFDGVSGGDGSQGDFHAQVSANHIGVQRLSKVIFELGIDVFVAGIEELNSYARRLACASLSDLPDGHYEFEDVMDSDGFGSKNLTIHVDLYIEDNSITLDFAKTSLQTKGNINCPMSVTAAAAYYVFRCLMPEQTPACAGAFDSIRLIAPEGTLVNALSPSAVAAGNVETSTRIVDVILGALAKAAPERLPAASQGTMNNVAMGIRNEGAGWDYYETIAGGMGASSGRNGLTAVQSHMTNTLNTPIESLEMHYPLRIVSYEVRKGSGGSGEKQGGNGVVKRYRFSEAAIVTLLTERRFSAPWGIAGGGAAKPGVNRLNSKAVGDKQQLEVRSGDELEIRTPGGGGWGYI